jgi:hypothetical protein
MITRRYIGQSRARAYKPYLLNCQIHGSLRWDIEKINELKAAHNNKNLASPESFPVFKFMRLECGGRVARLSYRRGNSIVIKPEIGNQAIYFADQDVVVFHRYNLDANVIKKLLRLYDQNEPSLIEVLKRDSPTDIYEWFFI